MHQLHQVKRIGQRAYIYARLRHDLMNQVIDAHDSGEEADRYEMNFRDGEISIRQGQLRGRIQTVASITTAPATVLWGYTPQLSDGRKLQESDLIKLYGERHHLDQLTRGQVPHGIPSGPEQTYEMKILGYEIGAMAMYIFGGDHIFLSNSIEFAGYEQVNLVSDLSVPVPPVTLRDVSQHISRYIDFIDDMEWSLAGLVEMMPGWRLETLPVDSVQQQVFRVHDEQGKVLTLVVKLDETGRPIDVRVDSAVSSSTREANMHELQQLRRVAQRAILYSRIRMELMRELVAKHTIEGEPHNFNVDFEAGEISFCDGRLRGRAELIASIAIEPATVLWGFAPFFQQGHGRDQAQRIRTFGAWNNLDELTREEVPHGIPEGPEQFNEFLILAHDIGAVGVYACGPEYDYVTFPNHQTGSHVVLLVSELTHRVPPLTLLDVYVRLSRYVDYIDDLEWSLGGLVEMMPGWRLEKLPAQHERQEVFRVFDDQRRSLTLLVDRNQFGQPEYVRVEGLHDAD